jgi:tetratricopeptide (TPR) repeat protein
VLDGAWELLSDDERRALAFCSVFVGGFTLEAAEAVLHDVGGWPLDVVEALRDKSLVRVVSTPDDPREPRLGLYDSIRDYALQKLDERGERDEAFHRHAAYVVPIGEELAETVDRHGGRLRFIRLAAEADNLLAVVRRDTSEPAEVVRAVLALEPLFATRGPIAVFRRLIDDALAVVPEEERRAQENEKVQVARLRVARAGVHRLSGENEAGVAEVEKALALVRGTGVLVESRAWGVLALLHSDGGRHDASIAAAEQGLAIARARGHRAQEGTLLGMMAAISTMQGNQAESERRFLDAIRIDQEVGNELRAAIDLANFGLVLSEVGRREEAEERLVAALELHRAWGNLRGTATGHNNLATLRAQQGRFADSLEHLVEAERLFRGGGYHSRFAALVAQNRALLVWALTGVAAALPALRAVVDELAEVEDQASEGTARLYVAAALGAIGDRGPAEKELERAEAVLAPIQKHPRAEALKPVVAGFLDLARAREGDADARARAVKARAEGVASELFGVRFLADRLGEALERP